MTGIIHIVSGMLCLVDRSESDVNHVISQPTDLFFFQIWKKKQPTCNSYMITFFQGKKSNIASFWNMFY